MREQRQLASPSPVTLRAVTPGSFLSSSSQRRTALRRERIPRQANRAALSLLKSPELFRGGGGGGSTLIVAVDAALKVQLSDLNLVSSSSSASASALPPSGAARESLRSSTRSISTPLPVASEATSPVRFPDAASIERGAISSLMRRKLHKSVSPQHVHVIPAAANSQVSHPSNAASPRSPPGSRLDSATTAEIVPKPDVHQARNHFSDDGACANARDVRAPSRSRSSRRSVVDTYREFKSRQAQRERAFTGRRTYFDGELLETSSSSSASSSSEEQSSPQSRCSSILGRMVHQPPTQSQLTLALPSFYNERTFFSGSFERVPTADVSSRRRPLSPGSDGVDGHALAALRRAHTPFSSLKNSDDALLPSEIDLSDVRSLLRSQEANRDFVRANQRLLSSRGGLQVIHDALDRSNSRGHSREANKRLSRGSVRSPATSTAQRSHDETHLTSFEDTVVRPLREGPLTPIQQAIRRRNLIDESRRDARTLMSSAQRVDEVLQFGVGLRYHTPERFNRDISTALGSGGGGEPQSNEISRHASSRQIVTHTPSRTLSRGTLPTVQQSADVSRRGTKHVLGRKMTTLSAQSGTPSITAVAQDADTASIIEWRDSLASTVVLPAAEESPHHGTVQATAVDMKSTRQRTRATTYRYVSREEQQRVAERERRKKLLHDSTVATRARRRADLLADVALAVKLWDERVDEAGLGCVSIDDAMNWVDILEGFSIHRTVPAYVASYQAEIQRRDAAREEWERSHAEQLEAALGGAASPSSTVAKGAAPSAAVPAAASLPKSGGGDDEGAEADELLRVFEAPELETMAARLRALRGDKAAFVRRSFRDTVATAVKEHRSGQCDVYTFVCLLRGPYEPHLDDALIRQLVDEVRRSSRMQLQQQRWHECCRRELVDELFTMYLLCRVGHRKLPADIAFAIKTNPDQPPSDDMIARMALDLPPPAPEAVDVRALETDAATLPAGMATSDDDNDRASANPTGDRLPTAVSHLFGVSPATFHRSLRRALTPDLAERFFAEMDRDGDGYLNFFEWARYMWPGLAARWERSLECREGLTFPASCDAAGNVPFDGAAHHK